MLLGVDCGSTAVKAVLFDREGRTIAVGSRRTEPVQPTPGRVEHDMERLWSLVCEAIRDALDFAPGGAAAVEAIGVTGHGDGLYAIDEAGRPLGPGIQSADSRARGIVAVWAASGVLDQVVTISGQRPYPYAASTLLAWMQHDEPERFSAIGHVLFCKDWIRFRLTGVVVTDPTDASTAFTAARDHRYSSDLLALLGLSAVAPALPPIVASSECIGGVSTAAATETGLRHGTPVAGGMHDVTASSVGFGNLEAGSLSITAGTFSINETLSDRLAVNPRWTARAGLRPGQWMNMSISPASSNNLDWFLRQAYWSEWKAASLTGQSLWNTLDADLSTDPGDDDPLFHPFLYGAPEGMPESAAFLGLRSWHDRASMLRAVAEGVIFNHRFHCDALRSTFPVDRASLTGGGTARAQTAQRFADTLGLPIELPEAAEIGALGAALIAGVGIGVYENLKEATQHACRVRARHEPDPSRRDAIDRRYAGYISLAGALAACRSGLDLPPHSARLRG